MTCYVCRCGATLRGLNRWQAHKGEAGEHYILFTYEEVRTWDT